MSKGNTSSDSRVAPVFNYLVERDASGRSWLAKLLALPERSARAAIQDPGVLLERAWSTAPKERGLPPSRELLVHLVELGAQLKPKPGRTKASAEAEAQRERLLTGDVETIRRAKELLCEPVLPPKAWYILEGYTWPDVYLRTEQFVIVVEGKNEERKHTTRTDWMEIRYQMLRHLDGAWPRGETDPPVIGFYIVEAEAGSTRVPPKWIRFAEDTISRAALDGSLPHRTADDRKAIADSFLGVTTWQALCAALDIPTTTLC
jgi:hypothetical protein